MTKKKTLLIAAIACIPLLLVAATFNGFLDIQQRAAAPPNPDSGYFRVWNDVGSATQFHCKNPSGATCYFDPLATTSTPGIVQPDGTTITISGGVITAVSGSAQTIAHGTASLGTSAISSGACASVVTVSASGVATTDNLMADFNADPTSTTGYQAGTMLTVVKWATANNVNFKVCNNTSSSITPGSITLNWRVVR